MKGRVLGLALALFLTLPLSGEAANWHVRAGATGTADGSDWTNACTDFSGSCAVASLVRGDTYYVATGTYAALTLSKAESGTSVITIKGATVADHGTDTGWQATYSVSSADGGAQAQFSFSGDRVISFTTSYWTFDGNVGSGNTSSAYGFLLKQPSDCSTNPQKYLTVGKTGAEQTAITVKHVAIVSCGSGFDVAQLGFGLGCGNCYITASTFANSLIDGAENSWSTTNLNGVTIELNWSQNQWSSPANHGESLATNNCSSADSAGCISTAVCAQGECAKNNTFRYNIVKNCRGTACLAAIGPGNVKSMNTWSIYGNVFVDTQGGDGIIASGGADFVIADTVVYNNTCVDCGGAFFRQCQSVTPCLSSSGNVIKNNILYNGNCYFEESTGSAIDNDYNAFLTCSQPETETNGQTLTLDPFVNSALGDAGDYHLTTSAASTLNAGLTLASPYNQDLDGNTRAADGKWDRGAFESGSGTSGSRPPVSSRPGASSRPAAPSRPLAPSRPSL